MFIFLREIECVSDVNDLKETFDDITLENNDEEDVYSIFGKVCVVCCKRLCINLITCNLF